MQNLNEVSTLFFRIPWFNLLFYTFIVFLLIFICVILYLKSKYGFWVSQPVFHVYDFSYYFYPPGIIRHDLPEKNKYTNFKDITTTVYEDLSSLHKKEIIYFVKEHYLKNGNNLYLPEAEHIFSYFEGLYGNGNRNVKENEKHSGFFSLYWEKRLVTDLKKDTVVEDKKIIGLMTSRVVQIRILSKNAENPIPKIDAYYVDYLCVDKAYRKKGIAPQLIQTHEYTQRHLNPKIQICLFKREGELTGIIPLCVYTTYGFSVEKWHKPPALSPRLKLLEFTKQNLTLLRDFLMETEHLFDIIIENSFSNLLTLIQTKNIYIYAVLEQEQDRILCVYFYRKTCVFIEKDLEVLTCYASVKGENCSQEVFISGFKNSFWLTAEREKFGFCAMENISHNHILVQNLLLKTKPTIKSPTAYFFYNFAYPTFSAERVLCKGT